MDRRKFLARAGSGALLSLSPDWMHALASAANPPDASAPVVFWKSGAAPGQTVLIAGHALEKAQVSIARLDDAAMPGPPPKRISSRSLSWQSASILTQAGTYLCAQVPEAFAPGLFALRVQNSQGEAPVRVLNRPELWWSLRETGPAAAPGSELRVFGQFLQLQEKPPRVSLRDSAGQQSELHILRASPYSLAVHLPATTAIGTAVLQVHNGFGGEAGWSDPLPLEVAAATPWPTTIFSVRDFGGVGDSWHDDTPAFQAALKAAERNRGGVVLVPRGVYRITSTLSLPAKTTLRGEDRERVWLMVPKTLQGMNTVIGGMGEFAVEELSIAAQTPLHIITAPDVDTMYTKSAPWGEPGDATAPDVRLRRLRIHHLRYAHRTTTADKDPRRLEESGPSTIALSGARISIRDCVVVSSGMPIILHNIRQSRVTGNEFRIGRNGWYGFWGARETLVEDNLFEGQDLEASYGSFANYGDSSGTDVSRLYIAGNQYRNGFGGEREALTFDSSGPYPWRGRITGATANSVLINSAIQSTKNAWAGLACLVTGGKGLGQHRRIAGNDGAAVTLEQPWDVTPDATSTVAILPFKRDVVVYKNVSQDASVGVQLWGGGYNFIIDSNHTQRSGGFWGSAAEYTDQQASPPAQLFLPLYFTQWLRNVVQEGFVFEQGPDTSNGAVCGLYVRDIPETPEGGVLTFANLIRENDLHDRSKIVLRYFQEPEVRRRLREVLQQRGHPWSLATVIEDNSVTDSPIGIDLEPGFDGVVLRGNRFTRVAQEIRRADWGLKQDN
ncbi:MAG: hypothetical protein JST79_20055 [Acidobacteria bacterium]|nr:hypothetical protein [Acidobacteriota bacterium]